MKKKAILIGGILGIFVLLAAGLYSVRWLTTPVAPATASSQRFVVTKGDSITSVGEKLYNAGLIKHPLLFRFAVWQQRLDTKIQAGSFLLAPDQSVWEIAQALTQGTEDVWVVIPEGLRVEEIARTFEQADLEAFDATEFISLAKTKEGYLFPDTYLVPKLITAPEVFALLTKTFDTKVTQGLADEIAASKYSLEQAVIMASLIQREAGKDPEEMRHVAGVLWNRIEAGQGLGVDATLQYIDGQDPGTGRWWTPPDIAVKSSTSPYNTYAFAGLPPGPIDNPGVAAIRAALNPIQTSDFYYLHADGQIYYARDLAGHTANIDRYLR